MQRASELHCVSLCRGSTCAQLGIEIQANVLKQAPLALENDAYDARAAILRNSSGTQTSTSHGITSWFVVYPSEGTPVAAFQRLRHISDVHTSKGSASSSKRFQGFWGDKYSVILDTLASETFAISVPCLQESNCVIK